MFNQNQCSFSFRMGVHVQSEWVFILGQNMQRGRTLTSRLPSKGYVNINMDALPRSQHVKDGFLSREWVICLNLIIVSVVRPYKPLEHVDRTVLNRFQAHPPCRQQIHHSILEE